MSIRPRIKDEESKVRSGSKKDKARKHCFSLLVMRAVGPQAVGKSISHATPMYVRSTVPRVAFRGIFVITIPNVPSKVNGKIRSLGGSEGKAGTQSIETSNLFLFLVFSFLLFFSSFLRGRSRPPPGVWVRHQNAWRRCGRGGHPGQPPPPRLAQHLATLSSGAVRKGRWSLRAQGCFRRWLHY